MRTRATHLSGLFLRSFCTAFTVVGLSILTIAPSATLAQEQAAEEEAEEFFDLPLESLMDIEVTSVSKKAEKISEAPAAIFVITQEDMRRGGFTTIPEALRIVPGLQVAQIDSNKWAITSRGFNRQFSNKLLVLIDGRTVYTPLFSGVWWDVQDTMIEDVERIEVIRGPGATLWGANAVNGVINIITKRAEDTQGYLISAGAGKHERLFGNARYGGKIDDKGHYRIYAKRFLRDETQKLGGSEAGDDWYQARGGFRADWDKSEKDEFTFQGDFYDGSNNADSVFPSLTAPFVAREDVDINTRGFNLLGRWTHTYSPDSEVIFQTYVDFIARDISFLDQQRLTYDFDLQHTKKLSDRHELIWGLGYRYIKDNLNDSAFLDYDPDSDSYDLISAFVQDKITLLPEEVFLTLGTKIEHTDYTGFEYQPSARLSWIVDEKQTLWSSVARAVRTPSRAENGLTLIGTAFPPGFAGPGLPAGFLEQIGNRDIESENLIAYEIGYRVKPRDYLSVDITGFYNDYEDLRTFEAGMPFLNVTSPFFAPHLVLPFNAANNGFGNSYGVEVTTNWQVTDEWRVAAAYTFFNIDLDLDPGSSDIFLEGEEDNSPNHQFNIRSYLSLPYDLEWDNMLFYIDNLRTPGTQAYIRVDTRLGWQATDYLELSLIGTNLFDDWHQEFSESIFTEPSEIGRSIFGRATLTF